MSSAIEATCTARSIAADEAVRDRLTVGSIGERIREARERAGMSQDELAAKAGTTATTVSRHERGVGGEIGADLLARMARPLGVDPGYLITGRAGPDENEPYTELADFLATPEGQQTSPSERDFLRSYRGKRRPTVLLYHFLLQAYRSGEGEAEARLGAEETEAAYERAIKRGGRPLKPRGKR